jgi:hypothetical protein
VHCLNFYVYFPSSAAAIEKNADLNLVEYSVNSRCGGGCLY